MPTRGRRPRDPHRQASRRSAGLRPASRGSAKPAPMTRRHANPRPKAARPPSPGEQKERRSPTGIARERETSPDDAASCQCPSPGEQKERRSPTGIARERETSPDDAASCQHAAEGRETPIARAESAGTASRGSAKPPHDAASCPTRGRRPRDSHRQASRRSAGLRPASRGSAKPAPTTQRYAHVSAAPSSNPGNRTLLTAAMALFADQKNLSE